MQVLDVELARFDALLGGIADETYKAFVTGVLGDLKSRGGALRAALNQTKYDELRLGVLVESQRVLAWTAPPKVLPPNDRAKPMEPALPKSETPAPPVVAVNETSTAPTPKADAALDPSRSFLEQHCTDCHDDAEKKGGLDLTALIWNPEDAANLTTWVKVHDRIRDGEMPPKKKPRPEAAALATFLQSLSGTLTANERAIIARDGRATQRRLNAYEYENALRDLFHMPWLQIKASLPDDGVANRFNKSGKALDVSHVQVARFMSLADYAIREAISVQATRPPTATRRFYAREQKTLSTEYRLQQLNTWPDRQNFPLLGTTTEVDVRKGFAPLTVGAGDPVKRELEAVGWVARAFPKWKDTPIPVSGRYRLRYSGYTIWVGPNGYAGYFKKGEKEDAERIRKGRRWQWADIDNVSPGRRDEPIDIYAESAGQNRLLGGFDLTPEPAVHELEVWLRSGETIVPAAIRLYYPRPPFPTNPHAQRDGAPGVAFRWLEIEGPLYDDATAAGYRLMFGDLPLMKFANGGKDLAVTSAQPKADAERLLRGFVKAAFRRPAEEAEVGDLLALIHAQMDAGVPFTEAMIAGYTAALASPGFLVLEEKPGVLDAYALAARLAFFLWNSPPDATLRAVAASGHLHEPEVLRHETERLLGDPKATRFIEAFLDYWLDLRKMEDTSPSITLYNDYYLDDALTEAALAEPRLFFAELLRRDLPARNVVASDFTFLNERLAGHYGVPGVSGIAMRRVALPADSPRGGLLTQAAVLKVTANGTTTSPVLRGKWITERILGREIPPPPPVGVVDPDIHGAVTIRQQLEKHRENASCASCHSKMDPPGFALENFDILGGWRDRYRAVAPGKIPATGFGKNGAPFEFYHGLPVDAAGELPDGRAFKDVRDFKRLLLTDEAQIARNFVQQLIIYASGSPVRFADREAVEQILQRTKPGGHGVRQIIHEIVQSELFRSK